MSLPENVFFQLQVSIDLLKVNGIVAADPVEVVDQFVCLTFNGTQTELQVAVDKTFDSFPYALSLQDLETAWSVTCELYLDEGKLIFVLVPSNNIMYIFFRETE